MQQFSPKQYSLVIHKKAKEELDQLIEQDQATGSAILTFLQEAKENQAILENLTRNGFVSHEDPRYDVKELVGQRAERRNIWRVRHWSLQGAASKYRIVYAFHPTQFRYYVLAVVDRAFDYDPSHEVTRRIVAVYDSLDIPNY